MRGAQNTMQMFQEAGPACSESGQLDIAHKDTKSATATNGLSEYAVSAINTAPRCNRSPGQSDSEGSANEGCGLQGC